MVRHRRRRRRGRIAAIATIVVVFVDVQAHGGEIVVVGVRARAFIARREQAQPLLRPVVVVVVVSTSKRFVRRCERVRDALLAYGIVRSDCVFDIA